MGCFAAPFLHIFCGQYCAQAHGWARKLLIYKEKFSLLTFWAGVGFSTPDGVADSVRRTSGLGGLRLRICFKGMHINCGKRCVQAPELPTKSLIRMGAPRHARFLGMRCCQFRQHRSWPAGIVPIFAARASGTA